jgi:hypothetical protein
MKKSVLIISLFVLSLVGFQSIASASPHLCYDLRGVWQEKSEIPVGRLAQFQEREGTSRFSVELTGALPTETQWLVAKTIHEPILDPSCLGGNTSRRCDYPAAEGGVVTTFRFESNGFIFDFVEKNAQFLYAKLTLGENDYWANPSPCFTF